ncbi:MAG: acyl carrier protein [Clostridia bacterium]|nr:acyl carrier protein [Clostridia bacterium]
MNMFEKVKAIVMDQLSISDEDMITLNTTLEDLGADSLDMVEVIMAIEDEFDVQIKDEDLESLKTLADLIDYINK